MSDFQEQITGVKWGMAVYEIESLGVISTCALYIGLAMAKD
jgi:hypothetical protein